MIKMSDLVREAVHRTKVYLGVPSVIGFEGPLLNKLEDDYRAMGLEVERTDRLLAVSGPKPQSHILTCHIDRHGILYTNDHTFEYIAFVFRRPTDDPEDFFKLSKLQELGSRFVGQPVFAYDPETGRHLGSGVIEDALFSLQRQNLMFRIDSSIDPKHQLNIFTPVSYAHIFFDDGNEFGGQIDNALSLGMVATLFKYGFEGTAIFTTEEEIGRSWIHLKEYLEHRQWEPKELLVLDCSPYPTPHEAHEGDVVLRNRDAIGVFNHELLAHIRELCDRAGIPYSLKDEYVVAQNRERAEQGLPPLGLGRTELGYLVRESQGRFNGVTLQVPTYNYHSNRETTTWRAIEHMMRLLALLVLPEAYREVL
jgi:hypothetical protein